MKNTCFGAGLVALDVILNGSPSTLPKLSAGGSCGNVLSILAYLGWHTYPIARLADNKATAALIHDLSRWNIHTNHLSVGPDGSTPIIIHRILKNANGKPVHRFEFRDPETKAWLPQFKPITKTVASQILDHVKHPGVFYFDRMNPGTLDLVKALKDRGSIIYFEPSSTGDIDAFEKYLPFVDIIKYSSERIPDYRQLYNSSRCLLEIETLGEQGLQYRYQPSGDRNWKKMPGFTLDPIQDAAGAGDWCSAGIIYSLCSQEKTVSQRSVHDIEKALNFGQALGALNCLYDGARGMMYHHTRADVMKVVERLLTDNDFGSFKPSASPRIVTSTHTTFSDLY